MQCKKTWVIILKTHIGTQNEQIKIQKDLNKIIKKITCYQTNTQREWTTQKDLNNNAREANMNVRRPEKQHKKT